jgi:hypothetical protein
VQAPRGETEGGGRRLVKPLRVVDQTQQTGAGGDVGQQ